MKGTLAIWSQKLLNEDSVVNSGRKYVLRTDLLFGSSSLQQPQQVSNCHLI